MDRKLNSPPQVSQTSAGISTDVFSSNRIEMFSCGNVNPSAESWTRSLKQSHSSFVETTGNSLISLDLVMFYRKAHMQIQHFVSF